MSGKVQGISLDIIWNNCFSGFLGKFLLCWSRGQIFLRIWPWWKDFRSYSDLRAPIILQAYFLPTYAWRGEDLLPGPKQFIPRSTLTPLFGPFHGMTGHPLSFLPIHPSGNKLTGNISTPEGNDLSDQHTSARIPLLGSKWLLQPHLDVLHSASDHVLYDSEIYLISLKTGTMPCSAFVSPMRHIIRQTAESWDHLRDRELKTLISSKGGSLERKSFCWYLEFSLTQANHVPTEPRGLSKSQFINFQWEKEIDQNVLVGLVWVGVTSSLKLSHRGAKSWFETILFYFMALRSHFCRNQKITVFLTT